MKATGVSVTKKSSALLQVVALTSPDSRFDQLFLSNYATINIIDNLKRIKGVGDVQNFTPADYSMRVWLDSRQADELWADAERHRRGDQGPEHPGRGGPHRLAARRCRISSSSSTSRPKGRLTTVEEFGSIVVRANPDGSFVRVRDVARVDLGAKSQEQIGRLDGGPAVVLGIYQTPGGNAIADGGCHQEVA